MEQWQIALICAGIALGAVLLVSVIKIIIKKIMEAKKKELDMKKAEYPFAISAFIIAFIASMLFLKFYINYAYSISCAGGAISGFCTEGLYILFVQAARKGIKGIIEAIINLIQKLKASKNPIAELPQIIGEATKENNTETQDTTTEIQSVEEIGKNLLNTIFKKEDK